MGNYPYPNPVYRSAPTTIPDFRKEVVRAFLAKNPDAKGARILWTRKAERVKFPSGRKGFIGEITVSKPGYRTRRLTVSLCDNTLMAR